MSNRTKASVERALQRISTASGMDRGEEGEEADETWDDDGEYDFEQQAGNSSACSELPAAQVKRKRKLLCGARKGK
eukprot:634503-Hanusia_phi.AAC.1